ncbi:hypothetical protein GCM10010234_46180 [Streptomyces hawaiiensis]
MPPRDPYGVGMRRRYALIRQISHRGLVWRGGPPGWAGCASPATRRVWVGRVWVGRVWVGAARGVRPRNGAIDLQLGGVRVPSHAPGVGRGRAGGAVLGTARSIDLPTD